MRSLKKLLFNWRGVIITTPSVTVLIIALRLAGWLQPVEWAALDTFFQLRPLEPPDQRILIIGVEEEDIQKLGQWPVSDKVLATLLNKIKQQKPRAIGLDLYRDLPIEPGHEELVNVFKNTPNLIGIQKVVEDKKNILSSKIAPPPELERLGQLSASDVVVDGDGVVRRGILFPVSEENQAMPGLGLAVAATYLKEQGITPTPTDDGFMKFGKSVFTPFKANDGSYIRADAGGYQILINFRGSSGSFPYVSLSAVLEDRIASDLMRDRIVIIGSVATSINDAFSTPYSKEPITNIKRSLITTPLRTPGVEIHANIASQVIDSVLNNRPLMKVWPEPIEGIWIGLWAALPTVLCWKMQRRKNTNNFSFKFLLSMAVAVPMLATILIYSSYQAFLMSLWVPVIPPLLALFCSAGAIIVYTSFTELEELNNILELEIENRTQELKTKNKKLKRVFEQFESAQKQIITREKLIFLGTLTTGITYEISKMLHSVSNFTESTVNLAFDLQLKVKNNELQCLNAKDNEKLDKVLFEFIKNASEIEQQYQIADKFIQTIALRPYQEGEHLQLSNVNDLLETSIKLIHHSSNNKHSNFNIAIETDYDIHVGQVYVFAQDIVSVFVNIIDNAVYSVNQKSKAFGEIFSPKILLKTKELNDSVEVRVRDNGLGIASDILNKIFEPFVTNKSPEGIGLGLYISHSIIVEKHKGEIKFETEPGVYAEFVVILPKNLAINQTYDKT